MKILSSSPISSFGGLNFVFEHLEASGIGGFLNENLPALKSQSKYCWNDILFSLFSVYLCGGDCIEDLQTHLKSHFKNNPFIKLPSPDTVLRRLSMLAVENQKCQTKRGAVEHLYNANPTLQNLNIKLLKKLGVFASSTIILDFDNTITFNEKKDSSMTYKRLPGYQPAVCTVNENSILSVENRGGNSDAKSFQVDTLGRMFEALKANKIRKADHFRADAASYQYDVIRLLEQEVKYFYIGCPTRYVESQFRNVEHWLPLDSQSGIEVGEVRYIPFQKERKKGGQVKEYRLIVKRSRNKDGQINMLTSEPYEYRAIVTNNFEMELISATHFYNGRGNKERQFDVMKNDFGWSQLPFSYMNQNLVFLYFTAICRNLYHHIIRQFSKRFKFLKPSYRVKKFMFRFILVPAKWIRRSRGLHLRLFGQVNYRT